MLGGAFDRVIGEEITTTYGGDLEIFVEKRFGKKFTIRAVGANLLDGAETLPPGAGAELLPAFARERAALLGLIPRLPGRVIFVANEVGLGLVPETPLGRLFRDEAGRLNQAVAALADRVVFVAAGLPLVLKA